ncbi:MAG: glutamyl-tRNA reductase [Limibacillus sp.]
MAAPNTTIADLHLVGTHLRFAQDAWRDRLFLDEPPVERFLADLAKRGLKAGLLICTCERVEMLMESPEQEALFLDWLADWAEVDRGRLESALYRHAGAAALRHLSRVAASLDSLVLGEPQVLGQVKDAERWARAAGLLSPLLDEACQSAFAAAKRVRSETAIGQRPVTMAAVALQTARDLHGDLKRCRLLLLGVGETIDLFTSSFREAGIAQAGVSHPRPVRGEAAARRLGATLRPWDELETALVEAEVVITGLAGSSYSLSPEMMKRVVKRRRRQPLLIIDGGIPGDVDPACDKLEDVFLYDLDDLERLAREGRSSRGDSLGEAEAIIEGELVRLLERQSGRAAGGIFEELESGLEGLRRVAAEEGDAEAASGRFARELRHRMAERLRALAIENPEEAKRAEALLRGLFEGLGDKKKEEE